MLGQQQTWQCARDVTTPLGWMHFDGRWGSQEVTDVEHNALLTFKWLHDPDTHTWSLRIIGEAINGTAVSRPLSLYHHIAVEDEAASLLVSERDGSTCVRGAYPAQSKLAGRRFSAFFHDTGKTALPPYTAAERAMFPNLPDLSSTHWYGLHIDDDNHWHTPKLSDGVQLAYVCATFVLCVCFCKGVGLSWSRAIHAVPHGSCCRVTGKPSRATRHMPSRKRLWRRYRIARSTRTPMPLFCSAYWRYRSIARLRSLQRTAMRTPPHASGHSCMERRCCKP